MTCTLMKHKQHDGKEQIVLTVGSLEELERGRFDHLCFFLFN